MSTADATLRMILLGEDRSASKALKGVGLAAQETANKGSRLAKGFSALGTAAKYGAVAGIAGVGVAIVSGFKDAENYQKLQAQTGAVLKSTGAQAGVTSKQVVGLANTISGYSDGNDDAIQSGENMLLTFTNVQNKVGKGNDIFTQATKSMADMSVALGQDTTSSALQLGKALNDPIKGMTALQRVGVSFTAQQTKQVQKMVASGHTMKAQKLILGELHKEFGGSARAVGQTFGGAMGRLKDTLGDLLRNALMPLIPHLTVFANWLSVNLPKAVAVIAPKIQAFVGVFVANLIPVLDKVKGAFERMEPILTRVGNFMKKNPDTVKAFAITLGVLGGAILVVTEVTAAWNAVMAMNPIGLVVIALALLVAGLVYAYQHSEKFRVIVQGAFHAVEATAKVLGGEFVKLWHVAVSAFNGVTHAVSSVVSWVRGHWPLLLAILTGPFGLAVLAIAKNWGTIKAGASAVAGFIKTQLGNIVSFITGMPSKIGHAAAGMFDGIKNAFRSAINFVISGWNNLSISLPSFNTHIPGVGTVGGFTISTPNIPLLAKGGIVTRPTVAMIGEAGPEAVVPLGRGGGMGTTVNITVMAQPNADLRAIGEASVKAINNYYRTSGKVAALLPS